MSLFGQDVPFLLPNMNIEMLEMQSRFFPGCGIRTNIGMTILFVETDIPYAPPVWLEEDGKQQKQMHFNFQVDDLSAAVDESIRFGAVKADAQYGGEHYVTMLDPVGHPFCLCKR